MTIAVELQADLTRELLLNQRAPVFEPMPREPGPDPRLAPVREEMRRLEVDEPQLRGHARRAQHYARAATEEQMSTEGPGNSTSNAQAADVSSAWKYLGLHL